MDQERSFKESLVNLSTLPAELLVYIISFLSSLRDRVKLRFVSRWLRCVVEETPSLWKEFVWPRYDSREECSVKEVLKMCGQHIKVFSFPNCRVPSTVLEMLQYCSNVQHLRLPCNELNPKQLRNTINCMGCLHILELEASKYIFEEVEELLHGQLRQLTIFHNNGKYNYCDDPLMYTLKHFIEVQLRPSMVNLFTTKYSSRGLIDYANHVCTIPTGTAATFRVYTRYGKVPFNFSPTFPCFQLQVDRSGQVIIPCVKFSNCGILGLDNDVAIITDCQYGGKTMYMVRYQNNAVVESKLKSMHINRYDNLSCVTYFDFTNCWSLYSGHLEQLAIACPNLHKLNLQGCCHCLESRQGLKAIASHCHNLQGLNLDNKACAKVITLWEILSKMKLTHLAVNSSFFYGKRCRQRRVDLFISKVFVYKGNRHLWDWYYTLYY